MKSSPPLLLLLLLSLLLLSIHAEDAPVVEDATVVEEDATVDPPLAEGETYAPTVTPSETPDNNPNVPFIGNYYKCANVQCNMTKYNEWLDLDYGKETSADVQLGLDNGVEMGREGSKQSVKWWDIVSFQNEKYAPGASEYIFSNGHAMDVLGTKCRQYMQAIQIGLSGRHGPVSEQAVWEVMCLPFCIENDQIRKDAMEYSCCDCMDLSTKPDEVGYSRSGDWCREESGRIMCEELERCGRWECELADFACPRMEYNTLDIDLKGKATREGCSGAGGMFTYSVAVTAAIVAAVTFVVETV